MNRDDGIKPGEKLILHYEDDPDTERVWTVLSYVGKGGSSVVFIAQSGCKIGILKVFEPHDSMENPDEELASFLAPYRLLDKLKLENADFRILNNYIPYSEILWGVGYYECYIWSPDDKQGIIFEEYIRKNISDGRIGIHQLYDVVHILEQLTYCICSLHSLGLLHLDIKPSNFLVVYDRRNEISLGHVSLFDIDSIHMADDENCRIKVTDGFSAPELYTGKSDNRSDIYSIGAVLFAALMTGKETELSVNRESLYGTLDDIIKMFIEHQKATNVVEHRIDETLLRILKGCLNHNPNKRYPDCEALLEDIRRLESLLYPYML